MFILPDAYVIQFCGSVASLTPAETQAGDYLLGTGKNHLSFVCRALTMHVQAAAYIFQHVA